MAHFLAIDAGTTSTKVILFDQNGRPLATSIQEYRLSTPATDWVELEATQYWQACVAGIHQVLRQSAVHPEDIVALSVSSQGETIIAVDEQGLPLRPAIVWLDNRAKDEAQHIAQHFDLDDFFRITGLPEVIPTWPACKILWLKNYEPAVFARAKKYLLLEDYLLYRFSGCYATEGSVSTTTGYFDIRTGQWWPEMLAFLGLSHDFLPVMHRSGEVIGQVMSEAARETGLSTRTQVVTGAMDQVAAAVGSANIAPGRVTETTGTALVLAATVEQPTYDPLKRFPCYYHAVSGRYLLLPYCQTAGMVLKWFRDQFGQEEIAEAQRSGRDAYDLLTALAATVPPASDGLILLPHLAGSSSPRFNPRARGVYSGISLAHTKGHFVRAIMEAVAFMLRENVEALRELGIVVEELHSLGGAARSLLWLQIKADVLGLPIVTMACEEAASLGVAILAGVACGALADMQTAHAQMISVKGYVRPQDTQRMAYEEAYQKYLALDKSLQEFW